jgi:hypothetical protein
MSDFFFRAFSLQSRVALKRKGCRISLLMIIEATRMFLNALKKTYTVFIIAYRKEMKAIIPYR